MLSILIWLLLCCYQVNLATMEMYSPVSGKLRRTHHDGLFVKFSMSETDYSIHAKIGHMQVSELVHVLDTHL